MQRRPGKKENRALLPVVRSAVRTLWHCRTKGAAWFERVKLELTDEEFQDTGRITNKRHYGVPVRILTVLT